MTTLSKTRNKRLACGLGLLVVAALAALCLWGFSPSVTAGDKAEKKDTTPAKNTDLPLPPLGEGKVCPSAADPGAAPLPPAPVVPISPKTTEATGVDPLPPMAPPPAPGPVAPPPVPKEADVPPAPPLKPIPADPPPPVLPVKGELATPTAKSPPPPAAVEQDIKQLVAQLNDIRGERAKLNEREQQTIQTIKRKFQDQKKALEQLERELRQLGISFDDVPTESRTPPADVGVSTSDEPAKPPSPRRR